MPWIWKTGPEECSTSWFIQGKEHRWTKKPNGETEYEVIELQKKKVRKNEAEED